MAACGWLGQHSELQENGPLFLDESLGEEEAAARAGHLLLHLIMPPQRIPLIEKSLRQYPEGAPAFRAWPATTPSAAPRPDHSWRRRHLQSASWWSGPEAGIEKIRGEIHGRPVTSATADTCTGSAALDPVGSPADDRDMDLGMLVVGASRLPSPGARTGSQRWVAGSLDSLLMETHP